MRLIDKTVQNSIKTSHNVKFNRGSLMKLYEYTANEQGHEDGVFGGFNIRNNSGGVTESSFTGSLRGPGLFGYGTTLGVSQSLFTSSFQFVGSLPSELNDYSGDVNLSTMGSTLAQLTSSVGSVFVGGSVGTRIS